MKAVIFKDVGQFEVIEKPIPEIKNPGELLVCIEAASICGSDIHILADPPTAPAKIGAVLGHEFVGRIEKVGEGVVDFKPGDRIVCDPNIPCDLCHQCMSGRSNLCTNVYVLGQQVDGGFAQYCIVPQKVAVKIPEDLPAETAIFAEPMIAVMGAINKAKLLPGENVLIQGLGPMGMYLSAIFKANGAGRVFATEISEFRSQYASKMGVDRLIHPEKENVKDVIMEETGGVGVEVVVECVGVLLPQAMECVGRGGKIVLIGMNYAASQTIVQNTITRNEFTILGSYIGANMLVPTVRLLETDFGKSLQQLITHKISIEDFGVGLEAMRKGEALEVVIYPNGVPE